MPMSNDKFVQFRLLEGLLNAFLKNYPLSLPELRYLGDCSGSTSTSKFNIPKNMREQSITGASSKRQKGCKGKASEKMNPDDKLKQPRILDAFKRAGVTVSQATNKASSQPSSSGMMSKDIAQDANDPGEFGLIDLMAAPIKLDMQRFKFRTLHTTCLSLLNYSECQDSSSYLETELPTYLYLLRDLHNKLDNLNPSTKTFLSTSQAKYTRTHCHKSTQEFLDKIQPLFLVLRRHLDGAVSMIKDVSESCPDNWSSHSSSAGNPGIPYVVVSKSSIVTAVCKEILGCYRKLLAIPDLLNQPNMSILKQLLQTLQPTENFDDVLSEFQPSLAPCNVDYLYCGACKMLEDIMDPVSSFSYLLSSDVLITIQSIVNSVVVLLEKSGEPNGKNIHMGCSKVIIPFLRKRLGYSAHKLLSADFPSEDAEKGWQSKGDLIQKILQIYLRNSDSTSDLLAEILPKEPSLKTKDTQDVSYGFPTLCSSTIPSWYRVLHEENTGSLNKTIKQALKARASPERGSVDTILQEIQKSVETFVSLIGLCKAHEKVSMHAMAVKHGGKFIDTFLKAFSFLETHFEQHNGTIVKMLRLLQKATRIIQSICSDAKGNKRTMITSKVPPAKRSMERFLFQVKALLHNCSTEKEFQMGNLKHKDLQGHVVSSQAYGSVDEEDEEQMETDSEAPDEENDNDNAMDEDAVEGSNETPMEEEEE
ncbi:unnamed protein product [Miscanthus lutarioriparius]|uniref:Fanconi anemia group D2 protein n=1 Tax=Miscanthus lutarioriparius TaxID=422564 RepID=A0A811NHZ2_9POAL|nr:unnamed protein product [Miscanthus lutarioriparius]